MDLIDATRLAVAKHPGAGDSVEELRTIWGDLGVRGIYDAILAERARVLWSTVRAGANSFLWQWPPPSSSK